MKKTCALTVKEMRSLYGPFYEMSGKVRLYESNVPYGLSSLLHYAEFWGVTDDIVRERLVQSAPKKVLDNLKVVIQQSDDELDEWLAGEESHSQSPSNEYVTFSAMRMASDFI